MEKCDYLYQTWLVITVDPFHFCKTNVKWPTDGLLGSLGVKEDTAVSLFHVLLLLFVVVLINDETFNLIHTKKCR